MTSKDITVYRTTVLEDWIDYNGHMNIASYVLVFSKASDEVLEIIGMDSSYRVRHARSLFTTESHICYLREMRQGDALRVTFRIVAYDNKRLHVFFSIYSDGTGILCATSEQLFLHVDTGGRSVTPFDDEVMDKICELWVQHSAFEVSPQLGRSIMILSNSRSPSDAISRP